MRATFKILLATTLCAAVATAQNTNLPRGELQLSGTPGVIGSAALPAGIPAGYSQFDVASPKNFVAGSGSFVATPRLAYALYADHDATDTVVFNVRRSTDGGRNWDPPTTIYTCIAGENLNAGDRYTYLLAYGNEVYAAFHTNRHNVAQSGGSVWCVASDDQGQTWSAPVNVSTGWSLAVDNHYDVDDLRTAVSASGLHLTWEADLDDPANPGNARPSPNNNENLFYARVSFTAPATPAVTIAETAITTHANGGFDVNYPAIDAEGNTVLLAWNDDSVASAAPGADHTYSAISFDAGATWSAPFQHTPNGGFPSAWASLRRPFAHLDGTFAYVFMEDSRLDQDDVWMDRGDVDLANSTVTWNVSGVVVNATPSVGLEDVDGMLVDVQDGTIAVLYRDDGSGTANSNEPFLVVDQNAGADLIAGTAIVHQASTLKATLYDLQVLGNMIAAVWEECSGDEGAGLLLTHDRGTTFSYNHFSQLDDCGLAAANVDIDDLRLALTLNGDYNVAYVDDRIGLATADNQAFLSNGKYPECADNTMAAGTINMSKIDPTFMGHTQAFPLISITGTNPGVSVLGNNYGAFVGLTPDVFYFIVLNNAAVFLAGIDASGNATMTMPGGIPYPPALLGIPVWGACATVDWNTLQISSYTDPFSF